MTGTGCSTNQRPAESLGVRAFARLVDVYIAACAPPAPLSASWPADHPTRPSGDRGFSTAAGAADETKVGDMLREAKIRKTQVRKTPSWPRSWTNFSLL